MEKEIEDALTNIVSTYDKQIAVLYDRVESLEKALKETGSNEFKNSFDKHKSQIERNRITINESNIRMRTALPHKRPNGQ
jgi:hypothetical protein